MTSLRYAVALICLGAFAGTSFADEPKHTTVPLDQVKKEVTAGKAVLVDVREPAEWNRGHIKGAVALPLSQLQAWERDGLTDAERTQLGKALPKGTVVYCHCAAGGRSLPGGEALRKLGYDARSLKPGYKALVDAGFPIAIEK
ncbi:MAG: rhodanese-like domain-containing protein [Isosphaeraceae bacterium]